MKLYVAFLSIKGFSNLSKNEVKAYYEEFIPDFLNRVEQYKADTTMWSSYWDSTIVAFNTPEQAVQMLFNLREFFRASKLKLKNINAALEPCILGHFLETIVLDIKSLGFSNILSEDINTFEKLNLNLPNQDIYVTQEFVYAVKTQKEKVSGVKFSEFGMINCGENIGERELYKMWKDTEITQPIDKFRKADLSYNLPVENVMTAFEGSIVKRLNMCSSMTKLIEMLSELGINGRSGTFIIIMANIYIKLGIFDKAVEYIEEVQNNYCIEVNGMKTHPYKYNKDLLKTKAKCLSKIGRYEEAYDILYGMFDNNAIDSDILMEMASQLKRRSIYDSTGKLLPLMGVNRNFLFKAKDLYIEAYRNDMNNIYAALSAAYMYRIIGKLEVEKGKKLAKYIIENWNDRINESWLIGASVAQCLFMVDKFNEAEEVMNKAVQMFNPDMFMRKAVLEDISIYNKFINTNVGINNIIAILKDNR